MLTIIDCANLSQNVYNPDKAYHFGKIKVFRENEKIESNFTGFARFPDVSPSLHPNNHFYAALYIKFLNGRAMNAVAAIRGTVFNDWTNDGEDILAWASDSLGNGEHGAVPQPFTAMTHKFVWDVLRYNREHFPDLVSMTLTGHSLGGALAQLCLLTGAFVQRAVTFNAPGIGHLVSSDFKEKASGKVYNINARYGVINKIGQAIGKIYLIDVPKKEVEAKALFTHFNPKDYAESVKVYQRSLTDNQGGWMKIAGHLGFAGELMQGEEIAAALAERIQSYLAAEQGLVETQDGQRQYIYCQSQDDVKHWYQLETVLKLKYCQQTSLLSELNQVITAQHSIANLITALNDKPYAGFSRQALNALAARHKHMAEA